MSGSRASCFGVKVLVLADMLVGSVLWREGDCKKRTIPTYVERALENNDCEGIEVIDR